MNAWNEETRPVRAALALASLYLLMGAGAMYVPTVSYTDDGSEERRAMHAMHMYICRARHHIYILVLAPLFKATHATVPYATLKRIHTPRPSLAYGCRRGKTEGKP